ncbi:hypothetical protein T11_6476 [Trichinella zimbabwensis]|uniref:Uncharacterized protein n=1 Tax=Trichinella zimbabwensis TaxID=268475 RepID=A0A0V1GYF1_9BILA|nr:hypothetical protein T11_6476 [Trichinella zimbabwensis]
MKLRRGPYFGKDACTHGPAVEVSLKMNTPEPVLNS